MLSLNEYIRSSNVLWEENIKIPEISVENQDRLQAYKEANLYNHYYEHYYKLKCEQADKAGFQRIMPFEAANLLLKLNLKSHQYFYRTTRYIMPEYSYCNYDHYSYGVIGSCIAKRVGKLFSSWKYRIYLDSLSSLKCEIPYGVVLRINEIRKIKLFNTILVFAPSSLLREKRNDYIDPIVVASIYSFTRTHPNQFSGEPTHYFLAQW